MKEYNYFILFKRFSVRFFSGIFIFFTIFIQQISAQNCTVNAGVDDFICPTSPMQLHGQSAGLYKGSGNIHWTQNGGPSVNIVNPYDFNTFVTGYTAGNEYTFYLWAKCDDGSLVKDSVQITVYPMSTAQAGSDQIHCPGINVLTLSGNAPGIGESGKWQVVGANNGVSFTNDNLYNTTISLNPNACGITTLRWTITGSNSCSSYDDVLITNIGGVNTVTAGTIQTLSGCYSTTTSTSLNASNGGCGINGQAGHWTVISGPNIPTLSNSNSSSSGLSNLIQGTYALRWDVSGSCANGTANVNIVVPQALGGVTGASAGSSQSFCDGRTSFTLTGNNPLNANETGTWVQTGGPYTATINNATSPITTVTVPALSNGTYSFSYTIKNTISNCSSSANSSVTFSIPPTITMNANIVLPCGDSIATITYNKTGGGTVQWSIISGPANWYYPSFPTAYTDATTSPQLIYHLSGVGTYTIRFRISPGTGAACSTVTTDVNITTSQPPQSSNAGTPQILACNVMQTHLAGNKAFVGEGIWSEVSYPAGHPSVIYHPVDDTSFIYNLYPGTYRYRWLISNGAACPPKFTETTVVVSTAIPIGVDAGPDQTICYGSPLKLQASIPGLNETGMWTVLPTGPTFSDPTNPNAIVNNLALNTLYVFTWTIQNSCGSLSDAVNIQTSFDQGPIQADAGPNQCKAIGTTSVTLAGNNPAPGIGNWRQIPSANVAITDFLNPTTTVTGLSSGTYMFEWSIMRNGCGPTLDTVIITISNPVTPSVAGIDDSICGNQRFMIANTPLNIGEYGIWTQTSGNAGAVIANINSPTSLIYNLNSGYYQFNWTIFNGACSSNSDSVIIRVSNPPGIANAGSDRTLCGKDTVNLAANTPTSGTGLWTIVSAPNTPTFADYANPNANVSGLITGTYVFSWTVSGGPYCPSMSDSVTIIIYASANAGNPQTFCDATTVELSGNVGSVGLWEYLSGGTNTPTITATVPASNKATASNLTKGIYIFNYTLNYPGCSSSAQGTIIISGQPTTSIAGAEQFLCKDASPYTITLNANTPVSGHGTGVWTRIWPVSDAGASFSDLNNPSATYSPAAAGLYIFKWTITDGSCTSSSEVRVNLYDPPTISNAGSMQEVCGIQTTMAANLPTAGIGAWTLVSGPNTAVFTSVILPNTTVTNLIQGTYVFRWTIKNGSVCDSSTSTVTINVHTNPGTPLAGADQQFCENTLSYTLAGNAISPGSGHWSQSISDPIQGVNFNNASDPFANATFPGLGTYHLTWTASNPYTDGSCVLSDEVVITIDQNPSTAYTGIDFVKCLFTNVYLNANSPTIGVGTWTVNPGTTGPGPITFVNPHSPTTQVLGTGLGMYKFDWTITNGLCTPSTDQVQLSILDFPPTAIAGANQSICNGTNAFMSANSPGLSPNFGTWSQLSGDPAILTFVNPISPTSEITGISVAGIYHIIWTISNGDCSSSDTITLTKYPDVILNCSSNATICDGGTYQMTVSASGGSGFYSYKWESGPSAIGPWTIIPGATGTSFTTTALTTTTYYRVTELCGYQNCITQVTVVPDPVINSVSSNPTICSGSTANLSVNASDGTPNLLYQWYSGTSCGNTTTLIAGANSSTYTTTPLTQTTYYRVKVWSSGNGCATVYSDCISVFVPNLTVQPVGTVLCSGGIYNMNVNATSLGGSETYSYQWQVSPTNSPYVWTPVSSGTGGTTSSYTTATLSTGNYYYQCIITPTASPDVCTPLISNTIYVQVFNDPIVATLSGPQQICKGTAGSFFVTVTGGTGTLSYQWQVGTLSSGTATNCTQVDTWTNVSDGTGANTTNYSTPIMNTAGVYFYRCHITQTGVGCGPVDSDCMPLTVDPIPNAISTPSSQAICSGSSSANIALTSAVSGTTFSWSRTSSVNLLTPQLTSGSGDIIGATFTNTSTAPITLTYTITPTGPAPTYCLGATITASVTVYPIPTISSAATKTICNNVSVSYNPSSAVIGTTYSWVASLSSGNISGFSVSGSGNINDILVNSGTATGTITYVITPTGPSPALCVGPSKNLVVTVNPTPNVTATPATETFCSGNTTSITLSTTVPGSTFYYAVPSISGGSGVTGGVARATPGNNNPITNTLTNTTAVVKTATYTVYPIINGCIGTTITVVVTVNPVPIVTTGLAQSLCVDASNNATASRLLTTTPNMTGAIFNWSAPTLTGTPSFTYTNNGTTGASIIDGYNNPTLSPQTATYSITPTAPALLGGCVGLAKNVVITVNPWPNVTATPTAQTICHNSSTNIALSTTITGATVTYSWTAALISGTASFTSSGSGNTISQTIANTSNTYAVVRYTITPKIGTCSGTPITLDVTVNPLGQVNQSASQVVCNANPTADIFFSTTNTIGTTTYAWTNSNTSINLASFGSGDILSFNATNTSSVQIFGQIIVTPTFTYAGKSCAGSTISNTINVNPTGQVNQPVNLVKCHNSSTSVTFTTNNTPSGNTTYAWTNDNIIIGLSASGNGNISFTATNTTDAPITANIVVTPTYTNGGTSCVGSSKSFTITVNPLGQLNAISNQTLCSNTSTLQVDFITTRTGGTNSYSWTNSLTSIGLGASGSGSFIGAFIAQNNGTTPVTANISVSPTFTYGGVGCLGSPQSFSYIINATPIGVSQNKSICSGMAVNQALTTNPLLLGTTFTYSLPQITGGITGHTARTIASTADITDVLVNTTGLTQTATYTITPSNPVGSCDGSTFTVVVTIYAKPIGVSDTKTICSNQAVNQVLLTNPFVPGTTFTYPSPTVSGGITGGASRIIGTGASITDVLVNPTASIQTATYIITPTNQLGGCTGSTFTLVVTVNPKPILKSGLTQNLCSGENATLLLKTLPSMGSNVTYSWPVPTLSGGMTYTDNGGGNTITDDYLNQTSNAQTATYFITPTASALLGGCIGDVATVVITVNPVPVLSSGLVQTICSGTAVNRSLTTTPLTTGTLFTYPAPDVTGGITGGLSRVIKSSANITDILVNNTSSTQTATYHVTPWINNCAGNMVDVVVTVKPNPSIANAGPNQSVYGNLTSVSVIVTGNTPVSGTGNWSIVTIPAGTLTPTITNAASPTTSITNLGFGTATGNVTYTFRWTITNDPCQASTSDVNITLTHSCPLTYNENVSVCSGSSLAVNVLNGDYSPNGANITLTSIPVSGPLHGGSFTHSSGNLFNYIPDPLYTGMDTVIVEWCDTSLPCCSKDTIFITVAPKANAGNDYSLCNASTAFLVGNNPAPGIGMWSFVSGPSGAPTTNIFPLMGSVAIVNNLVSSTTPYVFRYTMINSTCVTTDDLTITNYKQPSASNAGADQKLCATTTSVTLSGNIPSSGTGAWSQIAGPNNPTIPAGNPITINGLIAGTYTFAWVISNANCGSAQDLIDVTLYPPCDVGAGNDATICAGSTHTLTGTSASNCGTMYWGTNGDGYFSNALLLNPVYIPGPTDIANGSVVLYIHCESCCGVECPPDRDEMTLTIISAPTAYAGVDTTICAGSALTFNNANATNYTSLLWTSPTSGTFSTSAIIQNPTYTPSVADISNGSVNLTFKATNACSNISDVMVLHITTVTAPTSILSNVSCYGQLNGVAKVTPSGGTSPYTYLWSNGTSNQTATALTAGTYTVTVSDNNGCITNNTVTISQPSSVLSATISGSINPACSGGNTGSATVTASGGTAPYTYLWTNGQTTATATAMSAGTYQVVVTDANGCTKEATVLITNPIAISSSITASSNVSCNSGSNGTATVTVSGGTAPYTYLWSASAGNQTTATASNLPAGQHTVTITGTGGCSTQSMVTITQPSVLTAVLQNQINAPCYLNSGQIVMDASGGTAPYTFSANPSISFVANTSTGNVPAGTYTVMVTDANNCTSTKTVTITQPQSLQVSINITDVSCYGGYNGSALLTASGGTPPYNYLWSNGTNNQTATALTAGTYTVTVSDNNGCLTNNTVTISQPSSVLSAIISGSINPACSGGNTGSATVTASGGTAPYTYLWTNGQTTATTIGLTAGTYQVVVTDANGCSKEATVLLTNPITISASITSSSNVSCNGGTNGTATVTVSGGTAPYTYLWSASAGNQTTATASNLPAGQHTVTITGTGGCSTQAMVTITQPSVLSAVLVSQINAPCYLAGGQIVMDATGGTAPYTFSANPSLTFVGNTTSTGYVPANTYTVMATDANNCTSTMTVTITQPQPLQVSILSTNVSCYGGHNGTVSLTVGGGTPPYVTSWSNGSAGFSLSGLYAGYYSVTVMDANNCPVTSPLGNQSVVITQPPAPAVNAGADITICSTASPISLTGATSSNTSTYQWSTSGSGSFTNPTSLTLATYIPSAADINDGQVQLYLAAGNAGCDPVSDFRILSIWQQATAFAGADTTLCANTAYHINDAHATNYAIINWTITQGTGTLTGINTLAPTYIPGLNEAGIVKLTLTATPTGNCPSTTDELIINYKARPTVNAGPDAVICGNLYNTYQLSGSATNTTSVHWTTSGTGMFNNANSLNAIYTPSTADISDAQVQLTLTVNGDTACQAVSDFMVLTINPIPFINTCFVNDTICVGETTQLGTTVFNGCGGCTYNYSWTSNPIGFTSTILNPFVNPLVTTIYTLVVTDPITQCSITKYDTVTVNPTNLLNQSVNQILCNGATTIQVNFSPVQTIGTTTYSWTNNQTNIGLASSGTGDIASFTAINTGNIPEVATIEVTPYYSYGNVICEGNHKTFTITVNPSGQINKPLNQVVCNGTNTTAVSFTTINSGGTTTYSWTNNLTSIGLAASGNGDIASFTAVNTGTAPQIATITVTPHFSNGAINCDGPDSSFTITVNPTAEINKPANQVVCNNSGTTPVNFTSNNGGGTITYSWTNNLTSIGLAVSGNGDIASFTAINTGNTPVVATITVTPHFANDAVSCDGPDSSFTITVNPTAQVNKPTSQVVCNGSGTSLVNFTTNNSGGTTSYSWTNTLTSIGLSGSGTGDIASFTAINTGSAPVVATITVTPHFDNGNVNCDGPDSSFTITVNPTAQLNKPANQVVCNNSGTTPVNFTSNNSGGTTTYSWTNNLTSIGLTASGNGDIASFTAINTGNTPVVATITVIPHFANDAVSCDGPDSSFTITVNPTAEVNKPANQVVCNGAGTTPVNFTSNNSGGTTTYSWTNNLTSIGLAASGNGDIASFTAVNTGISPQIATITVTPHFSNGAINCDGPDSSFTITVNPTAEVNKPANQVVCNGTNTTVVSFTTNNSGGTTSYSWTNTLTSIGLAGSGTGNIASFTAINISNTPVVATITVTPHFDNGSVNCDGPDSSFTITVNPTAEVNKPANQVVCNGAGTTSVNFTSNNSGGTTTYSWTNNLTSIGIAASGNGDIVSFTAVNTGTAPQIATITVTPHFSNGAINCDGPDSSFTITVNPTAQLNKPANQVVCNNSGTTPVNFTSNNSGGTITYSWTNNLTSIGLAASGNGDIASFTAVNTGTSPQIATITVTPHFSNGAINCDGPDSSFTITVNPTAQLNKPANQVVCNGAGTMPVNFTSNNSGGTTTYSWTNNLTSIGLAASGNGDIASFIAINTGNTPVVATITVTPHFANDAVSCDGPDSSFTITVNSSASPVIYGDTAVCCATNHSYCDVNPTPGNYSYQWSVSGGIIQSGTNDNCVVVKWSCSCTTGFLQLTKTNIVTGCVITSAQYNVTINPQPTPQINGNTTVYSNATAEVYYLTNCIPGHLYSWSVTGGTITSGQGSCSITVSWDWPACQDCPGDVSVTETSPSGCSGTTNLNVTQLPALGAHKLTGQLTYDNANNTPLNGVSLQLVKNGNLIATTTTAYDGYYEFNNIDYANYTLNVSSAKPWGGVTATDALLVKLYAIGTVNFTELPLIAADVNQSSAINATDALIIQLRVVGLLNQFAAGDWKFNNQAFSFNSVDTTYNFKGICVGDINKSYNTTYLKQSTSVTDGIMAIEQNKSFTYTIKSNTTANIGAMTLFMDYDQNAFEIEKVNNTLDGMQYKIENGHIALAWADFNSRMINSGETMISLQMKAKKPIKERTQIFSSNVTSEFADPKAVVLEYFELKMADVQIVDNGKGFDAEVYPNPANKVTNIVYTIPEQAKVKIVICNILGQPIHILVDELLTEGTYKAEVNATELNMLSGVYMYQIEVNGITTKYSKLGKIIFER